MSPLKGPIVRLALLMIFLGGCAHYVFVRHIVPPRNLPYSELGNLSRLVLVMQLEPVEKPAGILGRAALDLLKRASDPKAQALIPMPRDRAYHFFAAFARALDSPYSRVQCRLIDGPFATGFIDSQQPSSVLILEPSRIAASQRRVEIKERDGKRRSIWQFRAEFSMHYRLQSWPDTRELASGRFSEQFEGSSGEQVALEKWAGELEFGNSIMRSIRLDLLPIPVERQRLLKKGRSEKMRHARKAARREAWPEAAAVWQSECARNDPAACWNLGLYYERQGRWDEAREKYTSARESSAKKRERATLSYYLGQMNDMLPAQSAAPEDAPGWFDRPVAVLPFANQSNDVNAPERMRRMARDELERKGYQVPALDEISMRLREKGITQGGQLRTLPFAEISEYLGGARLLTGTIMTFKTVNVGLYNLHTVSVSFVLYDRSGITLLESLGHGFREILVDPKESGGSFLFGLAETAATKAARIYLERESREATATGLEMLPSRGSQP